MNKIEIIQGNALEILMDLRSNSIDLVIADPPYNLGKDYGNNQDSKGFNEYLEFSRSWLTETHRILKLTGTIYVFMGVRFISYLYDILHRELEMCFNSWIVWHYTQGMGKKLGFSPRHDDILMFNKSQEFIFNLDDIRIPQKYYRVRNNMAGANPGDVWNFSHVHYSNPERENHPTQKPEALVERMIQASSNVGDKILDPFAGSGTTPRVAQQLNRNCIGIEINPEYIDLINRRLAEPFEGFDSIDPRINRNPQNLPKDDVAAKQQTLFESNQ